MVYSEKEKSFIALDAKKDSCKLRLLRLSANLYENVNWSVIFATLSNDIQSIALQAIETQNKTCQLHVNEYQQIFLLYS